MGPSCDDKIKPEMIWTELIRDVSGVARGGDSAPEISGVEYDSRRVASGSVFVAMRGGTTDGNRYIEKALERGAAAIVTGSEDAFARLAETHPRSSVTPKASCMRPALLEPTARRPPRFLPKPC
jgi:UDP-N-acetylmuramyl tripeptide synthase